MVKSRDFATPAAQWRQWPTTFSWYVFTNVSGDNYEEPFFSLTCSLEVGTILLGGGPSSLAPLSFRFLHSMRHQFKHVFGVV